MTIPLTKETRIAILKRKLAVAIEEEEYLLAARLRDQINKITEKN
jgi:protein-arginine kinase activator protein McsA